MIGLAPPVTVCPPGLEVTVYEPIAAPPFDAGAVNLTVACSLPAVRRRPPAHPDSRRRHG